MQKVQGSKYLLKRHFCMIHSKSLITADEEEGSGMTADMRLIEELFTVEQLMSNIKQTREKIDWLNAEISALRETQGGGTWATDLIKEKSEAIVDFEDGIESWLLLISIAPFANQPPPQTTYSLN